jgi:hypothetical protein
MFRRVVVGLAGSMAVIVVASAGAGTRPGVAATLTSKVPFGSPVGSRFAVTWTLKRSGGAPYDAKGIFVRVVCPEGDVVTTAAAHEVGTASGSYRAVATVPAGGIGTISIGSGRPPTYFAITNPSHR